MRKDTIWFFVPILLPLDRELLMDVLFATSIEMMAGQKDRMKFKRENFEGVLVTAFESVTLGSLPGTLFRATVEGIAGKVEGSFMLPDKSFEACKAHASSQPMMYN